MSELFLAYRDGVGNKSRVVLEGTQTLIKDLPEGLYDLYHKKEQVKAGIGPNKIPGFLLNFCTSLEQKGYRFKGSTVFEMISNLEIKVDAV